MRTPISFLLSLAVASFLTSCGLQRPQVWQADERSGLRRVDIDPRIKSPSTNVIERLISVPVDPKNPSGEKFDLYYFVRMPAKGKAAKTVLYCAGGPGEIVPGPILGTTFADFLTDNGYNVVYFHQRGAGFSQIPASNQYDRFLRTSYAIDDLEAIRQDFLGEHGKWDAIIAWSYGTVVAQQYAHFHADNVERLILIAPMSRHKFKDSADAFHEVLKEIRDTDRDTVDQIYRLPQFVVLSVDQRNLIRDKLFGSLGVQGIFDKAEEAFGSLKFVIDSYCELKERKELEKYGLDKYSQEFFGALRDLRMFGWRPQTMFLTDQQVRIGHRIKEETLYSHQVVDDCAGQKKNDLQSESHRAFYVINTYDGINMRFVNAWFRNGKKDILDATKKSGGEAHVLRNINQYIDKIGITNSETIAPWDPAQYRHDRPTLILEGSADTVPAGAATDHVFRKALTGPRTLIEFPGSGHNLILPTISFQADILSGTVRLDALSIPAGETRQVLGSYRGRKLNENLRMELKPNNLDRDLKLSGFGIRGKNENGTLDLVVLIENTGNQAVPVPRKWTLVNKLFQATVALDPETINPRTKKLVLGTIEAAWRNVEGAIRVEKPPDLEPSLKFLCSQVRHERGELNPRLEIWVENTSSNPVNDIARSWTLSKEGFSSTFSGDPEAVGSKEIYSLDFSVVETFLSGFNLEVTQKINLFGTDLMGCVQEEGEDKLSLVLYPRDSEFPGGNQKVTIDNDAFSRTYDVKLPLLKQKEAIIIPLTNPKYDWKNRPVLASSLSPVLGLELLGWNVTGDNEFSLLLRKDTQNQLDGVSIEWVYIDPTEEHEELIACMKKISLPASPRRDCLIYSFLVMSSDSFKNTEDNKILGMIIDGGARVCHRQEDGRRSRSELADSCTVHEAK